jgi:hypothetical protein
VFVKGSTFIALYVDDLLIIRLNTTEIQLIKAVLSRRFQMTDLGPCNYFLGMAIRRDCLNCAIYLN